MESVMGTNIRHWIPPVLLALLHKFHKQDTTWTGNYKSWDEASLVSAGYDSREIFENVRKSAIRVKRGEVAFERDSVTFDKPGYSFPLLAALLYIANSDNNQLKIIDFGGSLGSAYFQYSQILKNFSLVKWNVVEQELFATCGRNEFQSDQLKFYTSIAESLKESESDTILFSSVLQYLKDPYEFINEVLGLKKFRYIFIDRTPFSRTRQDRITIQKGTINSINYSYPCWVIDENKLLSRFMNSYHVVFEFYSDDKPTGTIVFKGCFLERNE
jgi:putative methyltransferase (TIGR04325 family)